MARQAQQFILVCLLKIKILKIVFIYCDDMRFLLVDDNKEITKIMSNCIKGMAVLSGVTIATVAIIATNDVSS